jgi:hypothetical protein
MLSPDRLYGLAQLGHVFLGEGVQGPLDGGLVGHTLPPEGSLQRQVRTQPDIDLVESLTAREDAHEGVDELLRGRVLERLLGDVDAGKGLQDALF